MYNLDVAKLFHMFARLAVCAGGPSPVYRCFPCKVAVVSINAVLSICCCWKSAWALLPKDWYEKAYTHAQQYVLDVMDGAGVHSHDVTRCKKSSNLLQAKPYIC